jgi:hypothetical protein
VTAAESWPDFLAARADRAVLLARTVSASWSRDDTTHPFFRGCLDWHSAVHGTCALLVAGRLTGGLVECPPLPAERIAAEVAAVRGGRLPEEYPYGLAWALHLDAEAAMSGSTAFHELGNAARDALVPRIGLLPPAMTITTHRNGIWPVLALHRWARVRGDGSALATARRAADAALGLADRVIAASHPVRNGFLSPAHLLVQVAQETGAEPSLVAGPLEIVARSRPLLPAEMIRPYRAGLNFSRAWGCHAAWRLTGDQRYRDRYVSLVTHHLSLPGFWAANYRAHAHWIPQFGIFALAQPTEHS